MAVATTDGLGVETKRSEALAEAYHETWAHWPVNWSGIWTGALAALVAVLVFGLIGIAIGAHLLDPQRRIVDLKTISLTTLAFSVFASFLSFAIGGWIAAKIAGVLRSEPAMLHGAIVWLTATPLLVVLASLGAGTSLGAWHAGMVSNQNRNSSADLPFDRPEPLSSSASEDERTQYRAAMEKYREEVKQWRDESPKVARNTALCTLTALLLGLIGSVVGGWMASGEPMNFTYHRNRPANPNRFPRQ